MPENSTLRKRSFGFFGVFVGNNIKRVIKSQKANLTFKKLQMARFYEHNQKVAVVKYQNFALSIEAQLECLLSTKSDPSNQE